MRKLDEKLFENNGLILKQENFKCTVNDLNSLFPITHIHAFCFLSPEKIIIFEKKDKSFSSMAGGGIEKGETFEEALRRELIEEGQLELLKFKVIGVTHISKDNQPEYEQYLIRCIAEVNLIDKEINDPVGKVIARKIINLNEIEKFVDLSKSKKSLWKEAQNNINTIFS